MTFKPDWTFANEFVCDKTGVFVTVTKTNHKVPQFSIAGIGRYKQVDTRNGGTKDVPVNFIGIRAEKENILSGNLEWDQADALLEQMQNAFDWIEEEHKLNCEHVLEMQAEDASSDTQHTPRNKKAARGNRRQSVKVEAESVSSDEPGVDASAAA